MGHMARTQARLPILRLRHRARMATMESMARTESKFAQFAMKESSFLMLLQIPEIGRGRHRLGVCSLAKLSRLGARVAVRSCVEGQLFLLYKQNIDIDVASC